MDGAKIIDEIISNIDLIIIPLNKNIIDGIIENDNDLKALSFLKQIIQIKQYNIVKITFTTRYIISDLSFH